jgi:hypothetical protein
MTTTLNASTAGAGGFIATGDNSGSLALQTAGTTAVTIDTSQRVGIGTASPTQALTVNGQMLSVASSGASFKNITPTTGNNYMWLGNTGNNLYVGKESSAGGTLFVGSSAYAAVIGNDGAYPLQFATNNNVQATIDSSGVLSFNSGYGSVGKAYGCRVWCQYNGSQAIVGSANISSITSNGTGDVTLNFTTAMPDANYSAVASTNEDAGTPKYCNSTQPSTTTIRVVTYNVATSKVNNTYNFVAVFR